MVNHDRYARATRRNRPKKPAFGGRCMYDVGSYSAQRPEDSEYGEDILEGRNSSLHWDCVRGRPFIFCELIQILARRCHDMHVEASTPHKLNLAPQKEQAHGDRRNVEQADLRWFARAGRFAQLIPSLKALVSHPASLLAVESIL
jgi:hypothetical protein